MPLPQVSVLLEWDNPRRSNRHLIPAVLDRLASELTSLDRPFEVLVGHGDDVPGPTVVAALDAADLAGRIRPAPLRVVSTGRARYYEIKNHLADAASGSVLVFVDSDVLVEPGWMAALLAPFEHPDVEVVRGQSAIGPLDTPYARAVASTWFFPLRRPGEGTEPADRFYANNVAFRRETFLAHRFDDRPEQFRGQCGDLARRLRADGVGIELALGAVALHPPPEVGADLLGRSLLEGADWARRRRAVSGAPFARGVGRYVGRGFAHAAHRAVRERRAVGSGVPEVVGALLLAALQWVLRATGVALERGRPGILGRLG